MQSQKAVSAYFTSKQVLPFGFAEQSCVCECDHRLETPNLSKGGDPPP